MAYETDIMNEACYCSHSIHHTADAMYINNTQALHVVYVPFDCNVFKIIIVTNQYSQVHSQGDIQLCQMIVVL